MLIGYARVSTADQNPAHQTDALRRAGVADTDIHLDVASGAKASRPKLDLVLAIARAGDTVVITRLDRLGRSMQHLVNLGADLRDRRIGLKVLEQGIDTDTAEGRAMFGMLSVLAEFQRELIVANTRDGLAAARARGRLGGRRPKLTAQQAEQAQRLYDEGHHTVQQIADTLGVKRGTLYGHLDKTQVGSRPHAHHRPVTSPAPSRATSARPVTNENQKAGKVADAPSVRTSVCPTCGNTPLDAHARFQLRHDLTVSWLEPDSTRPGTVVERRHCVECQPREAVATADCGLCEGGPILVGALAADMDTHGRIPESARTWLLGQGWSEHPRYGMLCPDHPGLQ